MSPSKRRWAISNRYYLANKIKLGCKQSFPSFQFNNFSNLSLNFASTLKRESGLSGLLLQNGKTQQKTWVLNRNRKANIQLLFTQKLMKLQKIMFLVAGTELSEYDLSLLKLLLSNQNLETVLKIIFQTLS